MRNTVILNLAGNVNVCVLCKKLGGYQVKGTSLDRGRSCVVSYKEIQDTVDVFFML